MNQDYQKEYKKRYNEKNKIITFPLSNIFYEQLRAKSIYFDLSTNTFAKKVVTDFLNNDSSLPLPKEKLDLINEYIRISRGIANNINQLAYKGNIDERIDKQNLILALQYYEDEFKKFIQKI
jgi:hypothetical protein